MMEYSSKGEIDAFLKLTESPGGNHRLFSSQLYHLYFCCTDFEPNFSYIGRRYWVEQKRVIMYNIFKAEIFDRTLPLTVDKVREAIAQLGETPNRPTEARIRAFIYRIRKERPENLEIDVEHNAVSSTTPPSNFSAMISSPINDIKFSN